MTESSSKIGMEMGEGAKRSFLESKGHGVLSMGADDRGYGIPVSYSYDAENDRVVLGFVNGPESKKQRFATETEEVTLTVYEFYDVDSWESIVVTGTLQEIGEPDVSDQLIPVFFLQEDDAADDSRLANSSEFERVWYELRIDDVAGRHSGLESEE